jgi:hypothetical protein
MPGPVPGIHVFNALEKDVDARDIGVQSTPSFGRLCTGMTTTSRLVIR